MKIVLKCVLVSQYLMREERQTQLEGRQEQVESRLRQVLDYCRKISADAANRQNTVDELRTRVAELENEQVSLKLLCRKYDLELRILYLAPYIRVRTIVLSVRYRG